MGMISVPINTVHENKKIHTAHITSLPEHWHPSAIYNSLQRHATHMRFDFQVQLHSRLTYFTCMFSSSWSKKSDTNTEKEVIRSSKSTDIMITKNLDKYSRSNIAHFHCHLCKTFTPRQWQPVPFGFCCHTTLKRSFLVSMAVEKTEGRQPLLNMRPRFQN